MGGLLKLVRACVLAKSRVSLAETAPTHGRESAVALTFQLLAKQLSLLAELGLQLLES